MCGAVYFITKLWSPFSLLMPSSLETFILVCWKTSPFLQLEEDDGNLFLQKLKHHIRQHTAADCTIRSVLGFGFGGDSNIIKSDAQLLLP